MAAACAARSASRPLGSRAIPMPVPASPAAATGAPSVGWVEYPRSMLRWTGRRAGRLSFIGLFQPRLLPALRQFAGAIDDAPTVALLIGAFDEHRDPALRTAIPSRMGDRPGGRMSRDRRTESGRVRFPYVSAKHLVLFSQRRKRLVLAAPLPAVNHRRNWSRGILVPLTSTSSIVMDKVDRTVSFSIFSRPMAAHFRQPPRPRAAPCKRLLGRHAHESCPEDQQIHRAGLGQLDFGVRLRIRAEPAEPREAAACLRSSISRLTFKAPATAPSCNGARRPGRCPSGSDRCW